MKVRGYGAPLGILMFVGLGFACRAAEIPEWGRDWRTYFRNGFSVALVQGLPAGMEVVEVRGMNRQVIGWMFRTDQIEPYVKGYKDQIGMKVALSRDKKILGVAVVAHQETPRYFQKLTDSFFSQFRNRALETALDDMHTVTGATVSSRAIIRDVFESARELLRLEPVKKALSGETGAEPPKTPGGGGRGETN